MMDISNLNEVLLGDLIIMMVLYLKSLIFIKTIDVQCLVVDVTMVWPKYLVVQHFLLYDLLQAMKL
jgi:hypothetical protein